MFISAWNLLNAQSKCIINKLKITSLSHFLHEHLAGPDLDELPGAGPGVHLGGHVVEEHPGNHHGRPETGERRDLITFFTL